LKYGSKAKIVSQLIILLFHKRTPVDSIISNKTTMENFIFIDFEGKMDSPPSFVGILFADEFKQIILTDTLLGCVGPTKVTYQPLKEFLQETLALAEKHQTKICAFSTLERDVFLKNGIPEIEKYYSTELGQTNTWTYTLLFSKSKKIINKAQKINIKMLMLTTELNSFCIDK
jgi:hypothetical protein